MKPHPKTAMASRASVRTLMVACLPAAAVAVGANSPVLGAALNSATSHDMTVDDKTSLSTNGSASHGPGTNTLHVFTNQPVFPVTAGSRG